MPRKHPILDPDLGALTDDLLTPDVRVLQRARGHRFSSDDVATAFLAHRARPLAQRVLDLGCGLGSVLLLLAWKMPSAHLVGVEAQPTSFSLLERNVTRNALSGRVSVYPGDLRDEPLLASLRERAGLGFELVTGTPPYFPAVAALAARDPQRALARLETRGGVEDYVDAAARVLCNNGILVLCGAAGSAGRVERAAKLAGLTLRAETQVVPREGRPPLFSVWELSNDVSARPLERSSLTLRDRDGQRTPDAELLRAFSGFPPARA